MPGGMALIKIDKRCISCKKDRDVYEVGKYYELICWDCKTVSHYVKGVYVV